MRFLVDITPLRRSREFRLLYFGQVASVIGSQFTVVAAAVQVYNLTSSTFFVGLLGLVQLVPLIVGSLIGGALADAHDRRRLLLIAQLLLASTSVGLALNTTIAGQQLWLIYVLTALQAAFSGLDHPTRSAATPVLVEREHLPSALALNQLQWQLGLVVGPALGGIVIGTLGIAAAYWLDAASFTTAVIALLLMTSIMPEGGGTKASRSSVMEGVHFLRHKQALQGTFVIDLNAMIFGMPRALFPAIGTTVYGGGPETVGLLYAAPGIGALLGALFSGWLRGIDRQGRGVLWAVVAWGAAIVLFGLSPWLAPALLFLAIAGAADVVSAVFRNSVLQLTVPDRLRGRLSAIHIAVVTGGPRLGDIEAGTVAALTSPTVSVVTGGLACMAGVGVIARLMPELGKWRISKHAIVNDE